MSPNTQSSACSSTTPSNPATLNAGTLAAAFAALIVAGLYSLGDEYHQSFVPGRGASLVDCGIDTAGALIGLVLLYPGRGRHASNIAAEEVKKGTG